MRKGGHCAKKREWISKNAGAGMTDTGSTIIADASKVLMYNEFLQGINMDLHGNNWRNA